MRVLEKTYREKELKYSNTYITTHYIMYIFNPWNGAFIKKKKMKNVDRFEVNSGGSSGIIDDN